MGQTARARRDLQVLVGLVSRQAAVRLQKHLPLHEALGMTAPKPRTWLYM
jgi:hypothetical protein